MFPELSIVMGDIGSFISETPNKATDNLIEINSSDLKFKIMHRFLNQKALCCINLIRSGQWPA